MMLLYALLPLTMLLTPVPPSDVAVGEGPEPSPTPVSWELEFDFLDPRRIEVMVPGQSEPEVYWYVVYTVTNPSPRSRRFFPMFEIVTESLAVHETDMGISPLVFEAIQARHKITHPYLVHPTKAIGALLTGEDNARESVAIWRDIDLTQNSFDIYVAGLSGETHFVPNPLYDPEQPETITVIGPDGNHREISVNPKNFTLRKTLQIRYKLPGSPKAKPAAVPERVGVDWIMR